jgi:hypothetical protein
MNGILRVGPAIEPFCLMYTAIHHVSEPKGIITYAESFKP